MTTGTVMLEHVIPTYDPEGEGDKEYDMSRPATVVVKEDLGLRILLGPDSPDTPDLMLEKGVVRPRAGWWRSVTSRRDSREFGRYRGRAWQGNGPGRVLRSVLATRGLKRGHGFRGLKLGY
jgi:hypothetical protein